MPLKPKNPKSNLSYRIWKSITSIQLSHKLALLLLVFLGTLLRLEPALHDTVHFSYDQGVDISFVRNLVEDHKISLISRFTGLQGLFMGPLWTWLLVPSYIIGGGNPVANEVWMSLLGMIAIVYSYLIIKHVLGETEALLTAFYVALSGPFIGAAHIVLSPAPLTILMIVFLWFLWEVVWNENDRYLLWLGLLCGIFFQFEIGFAAFLLPATLIVLGTQRIWISYKKKYLFIGLVLFLLTFLPQLLFELRHDFIMSKSLVQFVVGENRSLGTQGENILGRFLIRTGSLWEDIQSSTSFMEGNVLGTLLVITPAIYGLYIAVRNDKKRKKLATVLILLTILIYIGFSLYSGPVWVWYRAGIPIVFVLLLSIGWAQLVRNSSTWSVVALIIFTCTAIYGVKPQQLISKFKGQDQGGVSTIKNQKQIIDLIYQDAQDKPFDLYVYTPPVYTYVWDYMFHWYASKKYPYLPQEYGYHRSENATNDFYLLIEPDDLMFRIDGWKGNFASLGNTERQWQAPGGVVIEKWKAIN